MLSFLEYIKDNFIFEEKEAGGKGADLRGDTSEYSFYHAAQNYNAEKRKHIASGKSDDEAHNAAIEYLRSPEHMSKLKRQVATKGSKKTSAHHESNKEDFHHTVEDGAHAAADYLHKIHREHGSIDSSRDHVITGPQGEKKTAAEIGITNADMVTPIIRKNGEKINAKINISNRNKSTGSSLKYATDKSKHIKVRTHGEAAFHDIVHQAAKKVLGEDHPLVKELNRLHGKKHQEKKKLAEGEWKNNPDLKSHLESMKHLFNKHHDKKDLPGSFEGAKSHLRKIIRGGKDVKDASKLTDSDKKKAREHLDALEKAEEGYKKSRIDHIKHTTKVLNAIYERGGTGKKDVNREIHKMHRKLVGVFGRRAGTSDVELEKGKKEKVPVIRTHLVSITRRKRGEKPHTGIHSLTNRMEEMSRDSSKQYRASSTEGGTINLHHGDDNWATHSLDKGSGHMMKIAPKKTG